MSSSAGEKEWPLSENQKRGHLTQSLWHTTKMAKDSQRQKKKIHKTENYLKHSFSICIKISYNVSIKKCPTTCEKK